MFHRCLIVATVLAADLAAQEPAPLPAIQVALIDTAIVTSPRMVELSGAHPSRHRGIWWVHNDSGHEAVLYATDSTGRDLGSWRIVGATNRDWEDMTAGPCVVRPGRCVYLGDIGDNQGRRSNIVVYRALEPGAPRGDRTAPLLDSIVLRYPGAPHNAEGLALTPDGRLLVATKDLRGPAVIYAAPASSREAVLAPLCTLRMRTEPFTGRLVTGLAMSPDGQLIVARTYVSIHVFRADSLCSPLTPPEGIVIPVVESQGEAVAFETRDRLILVSEGGAENHAIITRLRLIGLP